MQVLAAATLTEVEGILSEKTMAISSGMVSLSPASCLYNDPTVSGVSASVPEHMWECACS